MFKDPNLSILSYANSFTQWLYKAGDDDVTKKGYFDTACKKLNPSDMIIVIKDKPKTRIYTVVKVDGKSVQIAPMGKEHQFTSSQNPQKKGTDDG